MIYLERETPVTLAEAPRLIPAINAAPGMEARKPLHPRTLYNWATKGKRGVLLEVVSLGGILVTSRQAMQRFFARLSTAREQRFIEREVNSHRHRSPRKSSSEFSRARQSLAHEHGI